MYTIELLGSFTAYNPDFDIEVTRTKHGIIDVLARKMVEAGADREEKVHVLRGTMSVFARDRKLGKWADERLTENDNTGPCLDKFMPFPVGGSVVDERS